MIIVVEIQANSDGTAGVLTTSYRDAEKDQAESKYHTILSYAATSNIYEHTAFMLQSDGRVLRSECYRHDVVPEPTEE